MYLFESVRDTAYHLQPLEINQARAEGAGRSPVDLSENRVSNRKTVNLFFLLSIRQWPQER